MESTLVFPNLGGEHCSLGGNRSESIDEKCVADLGVYTSDTGKGAAIVLGGGSLDSLMAKAQTRQETRQLCGYATEQKTKRSPKDPWTTARTPDTAPPDLDMSQAHYHTVWGGVVWGSMVCTTWFCLEVFLQDMATWLNPHLGTSGTLWWETHLDMIQCRESESVLLWGQGCSVASPLP